MCCEVTLQRRYTNTFIGNLLSIFHCVEFAKMIAKQECGHLVIFAAVLLQLGTYHSHIHYLSVYLSNYGSTDLRWALAASQFLNWTGDEPVTRPPPIHRTAQTQNKRTQTSMLRVRFEPMTPVFERAKMVGALDRTATVIGRHILHF
jgi:hypothetical protein